MVKFSFQNCDTALINDPVRIVAGQRIPQCEVNIPGCRIWIHVDTPDLSIQRIVFDTYRCPTDLRRNLRDRSLQNVVVQLVADGRYLEGGYSPNLIANDPVYLTYNVACASDLAGTYDFVLVSGDNGELAAIPNQTITQVAPGYYEISEMTMVIFAGGAPPVKYRFTDICGTFTADGQSVDFGTQIVIQFNAGTGQDPTTGEITFAIEYINPSCCGLTGIKTVFKAVPK